MRKFITVIFLGLVAGAYSVQAACFNECKAVPECAKMGYKLQGDIFCPDGYITCPFDSQYIWCKEYTCKDGRYSDTEELTGEKGYVCDEVDYHHRKCYHCHCDPDPEECKWSNLNKGVGELGDRCCDGHYATCKSLCQDTVEVPEHAHPNKESCTGCNVTQEIITSWSCDDWYDELKGACYPRPCANGYTITEPDLESCGKQHLGSAGWDWESNGYMGEQICGKCTAKTCLSGFSTDYPKVDNCGTKGADGWTWEKSPQYAGDEICGKCTMKQCPEGFESGKASAKDCGGKGDTGWDYQQSPTFNGDTPCGKCTAKGCPNNSAVEVKDCGHTGGNGYSLGAHAGWNGDKECKKCEPLQCSQGTATTESGCGDKGNKGWSLGSGTGKYEGETPCKTCVMLECPNNSKTEWSNPQNCGSNGKMNGWTSSGTEHYNGETRCYTCSKKSCAEGYDTNKPNVGSCGTSGASGWDWDSKGYSGDEICGKCTAHTCEGYALTKCPDHGVCGTCQKGDTLMYKLDNCHSGWNKVGDTCVMNECGGYAATAAGCSSNSCGANGWTVNSGDTCQKGDTKTYKCVKSECPKDESTTYSDVEKCGTKGSKGWTSSATTKCNGDVKCYKCTAKPCENGYETRYKSVNNCGSGQHQNGWNFAQSNTFNGDEICGKCNAKACPNGETTDSDVSKCGETGADGWAKKTTGNYAGDSACYKCEPKTCGTAVTAPNNGSCSSWCTTGNEKRCVAWQCNKGYTSNGTSCDVTKCPDKSATSTSGCGNGQHADGWSLGTTNGTWSGSAECKACVAKNCPANSDTSSNTYTVCNYPGTVGASKTTNGSYSGDSPCYSCKCEAPTDCKWTEQNKGTATLSLPCCDGKYKGCTSSCKENKAPDHAKCTKECTGCDKKVCTEWTCNEGYRKENSSCVVASCPTNYSTNIQSETNCTPKASGWSVEFSGQSGSTKCGKCVCHADSKCIWNADNKGNATLDGLCCNNMYATCHSTCQAVSSIPQNGECSKWCVGCKQDQVCVEWKCKSGYTQNGSACDVTKCPKDSATTTSGCGAHAAGWSLGDSTGVYSGSNLCKKCQAVGCPNGQITSSDASACGTSGGWTRVTSGSYSGENACYKCQAKNCPSGEDTSNDASKCGTTGTNGWTKPATSNHAGNAACYKCKANTCAAAVTPPDNAECSKTCVTGNESRCVEWKCKRGYTKDNNVCKVSTCPSGSATTASACGKQATGWELGSGNNNWSGTTECKTCTAKPCANGTNTNSNVSNCSYPGTIGASKTTTGAYSGDNACYKCSCSAPTDCKWSSTNQGEGTLSKPCCNGQYQSCVTKCVTKNPPDHATCTKYCTGCNSTVCVEWSCNEGYTVSGSSCVAAKCPANYSTDKQKGSDCGSGSGWSVEFNGKSGEKECGKCKCTSNCTWNNTNKGTANLSNPCCNGNYSTCASTCGVGKTVPQNAKCTSNCVGCGQPSVCTQWQCKSGYVKRGESCVTPCAIGDVFYADGSCGTVSNYNSGSGKTPVGVVYYISDGGAHGKIINLHDLGLTRNRSFDPANPYPDRDYPTSGEYSYWYWYNTLGVKLNTSITDFDCNTFISTAKTGNHNNELWSSGKKNTKIMVNNTSNSAEAALAFYPPGVSSNDSLLGAGNWYIPTIGEWMDLFSYTYSKVGGDATSWDDGCLSSYGVGSNRVNGTLSVLGSKGEKTAEVLDNIYWSSTEFDDENAWMIYGTDSWYPGTHYTTYKLYQYYALRVSLEF